jgi:SAM-dependent methyltransferase
VGEALQSLNWLECAVLNWPWSVGRNRNLDAAEPIVASDKVKFTSVQVIEMETPETQPIKAYNRDAVCLLCGQPSEKVVFLEAGYAARQCGCGLLFTTPKPSVGVVNITEDLHLSHYYRLPARRRVAYLRRYRKGGDLLEVGSGEGHFLAEARAQGFNVCGLEPDLNRANIVRRDLGIDVDVASIEDCELPEKSFDVVYHCDLLSHFADPVFALRRMTKLLRAGGVLYFEVGLVAGLSPAWYRRMGTLRMPYHLWFYNVQSLRQLLANGGLEIVHMRRFGLAPGILLSRLGRKLGRGGDATRPLSVRPRRDPTQESLTRMKARVAMRYGLGRLFAGVGPETAFVIARPIA